MVQSEHTIKQYDVDLDALRTQVLQMGGLVESQIQAALEVYATGNRELADRVMEDDRRVNGYEVRIDNDCSHIIVRRQPAATDLRTVLAITKTVTDLERIGDEAEKIARAARQLHEQGRASLPRYADVRHMADTALAMLHKALDAFARLDAVSAAQVVKEDMTIDEQFRSVLRQLITYMMEDPRTISSSLDIIWIAKAIERIGDHAKNMAEYVIYMVKGTDVRHTDMENVERQAFS